VALFVIPLLQFFVQIFTSVLFLYNLDLYFAWKCEIKFYNATGRADNKVSVCGLDPIAPVRLHSLVCCEMLKKMIHDTLHKLAEKCNNAFKSWRRKYWIKTVFYSVPLKKCTVGQKVSLQNLYVYFLSFIRKSNKKSSNLIGLRSHRFSTSYTPLVRRHLVTVAFFSPCWFKSVFYVVSHCVTPYICEAKMIL
jgi:hypothetical protein